MRARIRTIMAAGVAATLAVGGTVLLVKRGGSAPSPTETVQGVAPASAEGGADPAPAANARLRRLPSPPDPASALSSDAAGLPLEPGVLRRTYVRVDVPLAALADPEGRENTLLGFSIPTFDGQDVDVEITAHEAVGEVSGSFIGHVAGKPGSFVILGYDGDAETGVIQIPEENYLLSISYAGNGILRIAELDPHYDPGCATPLLPPASEGLPRLAP